MKDVGILLHGRNLKVCDAHGRNEWLRLVVGEPPRALGTFPRAVLAMLDVGPERIASVAVGTGASTCEANGYTEAWHMRNACIRNLCILSKFPKISTHERLAVQANLDWMVTCQLLQSARLLEQATNTAEEIAAAAEHFRKLGCREVYHVTNATHAPQAMRDRLAAEDQGRIPTGQQWFTINDDMRFADTGMMDVTIVNPPHRPDRQQKPVHKLAPRVMRALRKDEGAFEEFEAILEKYNR